MRDLKLHVHNSEDGRDHVIDSPPEISAADLIAELVDALQLPPGDWVLDDEESSSALDPQSSLISNGVASGHHLRLHKNGFDFPDRPTKGGQAVIPPEPPAKGGTAELPEPPDHKGKKEEIPDRPKKKEEQGWEPWQWIAASVGGIAVVLLLAAGTYRLLTKPRIAVNLSPANITVPTSQQARFSIRVKGTTNQQVAWQLAPERGSITQEGVYTAPPVAEPGETVVITAASTADPSRFARARIILQPDIHVEITPNSATLTGSQSVKFVGRVAGTSNDAIRWSVNPGLGTISGDGTYTAPATIPTPSNVVVTATSLADPYKSISANVTLQPQPPQTVSSVQVTPTQASLTNSEQMLFRASVVGGTNQRVRWSASAGSINQSGAYTAPFSIEPGSRVTITARSLADPSKIGRAFVDLRPMVTVRITPGSVTLGPSQRQQQFTASVAGTSNRSVRWSANSGAISSNGLFTAPDVRSPEIVKVTAVSVADPSKQITAMVWVQPAFTNEPKKHSTPAGESAGGSTGESTGQSSGLILWSGMLDSGGLLTIESYGASTGSLLRGGLPGVPIEINIQPPGLIGIQEAPGPANGWKRLVMRSRKRLHAVISIEWKTVQ